MKKDKVRLFIKEVLEWASFITFIEVVITAVGSILFDDESVERCISELLISPIVNVVIVSAVKVVFTQLRKRESLKKFDQIFKTNNQWVKPKKTKAYDGLFKSLEDFEGVKYKAFKFDDTVTIFMQLEDKNVIEVEEISKEDFLEFYEII